MAVAEIGGGLFLSIIVSGQHKLPAEKSEFEERFRDLEDASRKSISWEEAKARLPGLTLGEPSQKDLS